MAQLTAVHYTADGTFTVHAAKCPDIRDLDWPVIRERVHLTAHGKAGAVARIWKASLAAHRRDVTDPAALMRFAPCCGPLPETE